MRSSYKKLGKYIREVDVRNVEDIKDNLLGVSTQKVFIKSIANTIGTDFRSYKIVQRDQFTYIPDTSRRGDKIGIALLESHDKGLVSQAYTVFEIKDHNKLLPEYLMMWFRRPEFDRYARFKSHGSVREAFEWQDMCEVEMPIPDIDTQREIVKEYNTIVNRIKLNEQLCQKLEETAQAIYKQWFVDFEFPDEGGKPYKSSGGEMEYCKVLEMEVPKGWQVTALGDLISYRKGYAFKSEDYKSYGVKVVRVSDLTDKSVNVENCQCLDEEASTRYKDYKLKTNDIIITTVGSWPSNPMSVVGKVVIVPNLAEGSLLNQNTVRIRTKNLNHQVFLYYRLTNKDFSDYILSSAQGSANQASITLDHIFSFKITLPVDGDVRHMFLTFRMIYQHIVTLQAENHYLLSFNRLLLSKLATIENEYAA